MPEHCVAIDTNVLAVAEGMHGEASDECRLACIRLAGRVRNGLRIAVDSGDAILGEYVAVLRAAHTAGVGAKLAKTLWRLRYDTGVCHQIAITPLDDPAGSYAEVPEPLRNFDIDDHKFLAVALAEGGGPPIFQALDEEWWERRADLTANGLDVQFLCVTDLL